MLGDLELHPGLGAEAGYTSNAFNANNAQDSAILRIAPHLFLSTLGEERSADSSGTQHVGFIAFRGGASATYMRYFSTSVGNALSADVSFDLELNPRKPVSFTITQAFNRTGKPEVDTGVPGDDDYARHQESIGGRLNLRTPGELLKGDLGYRFGYGWFAGRLDSYDNQTHTVELRSSYEFLPKTAIFQDAAFIHQKNLHPGDQATTQLADNSNQITTRIGLNGAVTPRISATLSAGYGAGFYPVGDEYESVLANVEARWVPSQSDEIALVFERSFAPAFQGNFMERNRVYLRGRMMLSGTFLLSGKGGVEFVAFGFDADQGKARDDRRYFADASAEYRFVDWLAVTAQGSVLVDDTDFVFDLKDVAGNDLVDQSGNRLTRAAEFVTIEAWGGLRAFF